MQTIPQHTSIRLKYVSIPNSAYNIKAFTIVWNDGENNVMTTLTPSQYTATTLAEHIAAAMTATSMGNGNLVVACTYNPATLRLTISAVSDFSITWAQSTAAHVLGFVSNDSGAASYTADNVIAIEEPSIYEIFISSANQVYHNNDGFRYTYAVPIDVNAGNTIVWNENERSRQTAFVHKQVNQTTLDIRLMREGTVVDLNGANWIMILEVA